MDVSYILMERSIPTSLKYWIKDNQTQNNYKDGQWYLILFVILGTKCDLKTMGWSVQRKQRRFSENLNNRNGK
jgi:hypothetical protein